jgi:hypothetical protein
MIRLIERIYRYCNQAGMRLLLALALFAFSCWWMAEPVLSGDVIHVIPYVLVGFPMMVLSAIIAAPQITGALADWVVDFFSASEKFDHAPPMYGIPQGLRKSRRYEEAIAAYEDIAENYPKELKPHLEMIDIALADLKDEGRAELIYQRGVLLFEDEQSRRRLARQLSGLRLDA